MHSRCGQAPDAVRVSGEAVAAAAGAETEAEAALVELLATSDSPAEVLLNLLEEGETMTETATEFHWPLGRSGDRVLVVVDADADLIAPIFAGEPEPEDHGAGQWVPLGIPNLDIEPELLAEELAKGPEDVWVVLPRSDAAVEFYAALGETRVSAGFEPPTPVFLPEPLTLADLVGRLPSGRDAAEMGRPSRLALFVRALILILIASAPDEWFVEYLLAEVSADTHSKIV